MKRTTNSMQKWPLIRHKQSHPFQVPPMVLTQGKGIALFSKYCPEKFHVKKGGEDSFVPKIAILGISIGSTVIKLWRTEDVGNRNGQD